MNLPLKVWRQQNNLAKGSFKTYQVNDISSEMSFLEMFDVLNEKLIQQNEEPVAFDNDCREGDLWCLQHVCKWQTTWAMA